jgi:hypothetical protein
MQPGHDVDGDPENLLRMARSALALPHDEEFLRAIAAMFTAKADTAAAAQRIVVAFTRVDEEREGVGG